jgi:hypothetical protein
MPRLQRLLSAGTGLVCTAGTGIVPLCGQAAAIWQQVDDRAGRPLSPLALGSVRALGTALITAATAGRGGGRWCEFSINAAHSADVLLQLFPGTQLVCVHRACLDVVQAAVTAHPWGLANHGMEPFLAAHPGNSVAAVAGYWAACTEQLLALERSHPGTCHRVRYEDLVTGQDAVLGGLLAFLGSGRVPDSVPQLPGSAPEETVTGSDVPGAGAVVPAGRLPGPLRGRVSALLAELGYPPLPAAELP